MARGRGARVLSALLPVQAEERPDAPWLVTDDECWTFGFADELVEAYAAGWERLGVGRGSRVALLLDNSAKYVILVASLIRVGAVYMPVNPEFHGSYLEAILRTLRPDVVVLGGELDDLTTSFRDCSKPLVVVADRIGSNDRSRSILLDEIRLDGCRAAPIEQAPSDIASVLLTSGTTGPSKGVVGSHEAWFTAVEVTSHGRAVNDGDVFHVCTPMFHATAWALGVWSSLFSGCPVVITGAFSTGGFWPSVRRHQATQLCTIGPMHMWLWNRPEQPDDADNPARVWTAVPLPGDLWKPFRERFGLEAIVSLYGQTEVMPATMGDVRRTDKPGSSGRAQPGVELRVIDEFGHEVPNGSVGELLVRPRRRNVLFERYLDAKLGPDDPGFGWFHTGDLVTLDAEGELYFVDRKSDHIRWRGHNVSSAEIENVLARHPSVAEVAAFAIPSVDGEDDVMVAVIPRPHAHINPRELLTFAADQLPRYAVPRYVEVTGELPRTATGKVEKHLLRQRGVTADTWHKD